jgi:DNA repair protein Rad10
VQQGNPVLKHIRNVRWVFGDIVPDYLLGQTTCALYLSLRYHLLHPDYLYFRIRELQKSFRLRVVLCHIDVVSVSVQAQNVGLLTSTSVNKLLSLFARQLLCVLLVLLSCQCPSTFMCLLFQDPNSSSYCVVARDCDLHP